MNRPLIPFGVVCLLVGLGAGYLMVTHPEGLNLHWPLGMALLAPAVFVLGGLHLIAAGLDRPRLANAMIGAIAIALWVIVNWAAFFTRGFQCRATVSFLGAQLLEWYPSEADCRNSLRVLIGLLDALVVVTIGAFWVSRRGSSRR
jgi:hypothetical protein